MSATKICRICGKEYQACKSAKLPNGAYRWQEVACSPEHGMEYLERVLAARNPAPVKAKKVEKAEKKEEVPSFEPAVAITLDLPEKIEETEQELEQGEL